VEVEAILAPQPLRVNIHARAKKLN
jgi:hypothetical protein